MGNHDTYLVWSCTDFLLGLWCLHETLNTSFSKKHCFCIVLIVLLMLIQHTHFPEIYLSLQQSKRQRSKWILKILSSSFYYFFILLLAIILFSPIALIPKLRLMVPFLGGLWLVLLAADIIVFNSYKDKKQNFYVFVSVSPLPLFSLWKPMHR